MLQNLDKYEIVLASNSPRRKELLQRLGIQFKVRTLLGIDESYPENLKGDEIVKYISKKKAEAYRSTMLDNELIITADTIVMLGDEVLGKPHSEEEAIDVLRKLSGHTHQVMTGIMVQTVNRMEGMAVTTDVTFMNLLEEDIEYYVKSFLPYDKAGGYGIQEWIGMIAVENIRGSYWNVMGLPVHQLYKMLLTF
ncbi:MAG: septum formation protein Maf [Bacteroidaceae bacterium]|nr:septum formation protein Maf [Bacteroidaceae bacterium]